MVYERLDAIPPLRFPIDEYLLTRIMHRYQILDFPVVDKEGRWLGLLSFAAYLWAQWRRAAGVSSRPSFALLDELLREGAGEEPGRAQQRTRWRSTLYRERFALSERRQSRSVQSQSQPTTETLTAQPEQSRSTRKAFSALASSGVSWQDLFNKTPATQGSPEKQKEGEEGSEVPGVRPIPLMPEGTPYVDMLQVALKERITCIPVGDQDQGYRGAVTLWRLLQWLAHELGLDERGSIIVLRVPQRDYDLSYLVRVIESEGVSIWGLHVRPRGPAYQIVIKLNSQETARVLATLERLGYTIVSTTSLGEIEKLYQERYEALLRYLNP